MRTGIVLSYNISIRCGFIKDNNGQKIRFYNQDPFIVFKRFDVVRFDIAYQSVCLMAVNIMPVLDTRGNKMSDYTKYN